MTILNNPTTLKSGLNGGPDGECTAKGFTTEAALDRLEEDILSLLQTKESIINDEGFV